MSHLNNFIRFAFNQFYTTFAWTYDIVAALVSFGEWKAWGQAALHFIPTHARILEIAHGPGHLHLEMLRRGLNVVGIDLSAQMGRTMRNRIVEALHATPQQARASAAQLPFPSHQFDCVVTTFPAEFVFAKETLSEVKRVLTQGGRFVIVPSATLRTNDVLTRLIKLAYQLTGQNASDPEIIRRRFESSGFSFEQHTCLTPRADVTVWVLHL